MKKIFGLLLGCIIVFCLVKCWAGKREEREFKKLYEQCQLACDKGDFQEANDVLIEIKNLDVSYWDKREAEDYVFDSELRYLITNGDEVSAKRAIVLMNEHGKKEKNINKFVQLAISLDNNYVIDLWTKAATLDDEELLEYLIKKNERESSDQVLALFSRELGNCKKPSSGLNDTYCMDKYNNESEYKWSVFNRSLDKYLNIAISYKNKYLAEKIIGLYTQTAVKIESEQTSSGEWSKKYKGVEIDGNHCYVEFNNSEKEEAQRQFNQAVKSGAFN